MKGEMKREMKRNERNNDFSKMFQDPQIRQMNEPKMFRKNHRRTNYSSIFLRKFRI